MYLSMKDENHEDEMNEWGKQKYISPLHIHKQD